MVIDFSQKPTYVSLIKLLNNRKTKADDEVYNTVLKIVQSKYNTNSSAALLRIKVELINAVFNTQIKATKAFTEHIDSIKNLEKRIEKGDVTVIDKIATFSFIDKDGKKQNKRHYSFATKFCHLHAPNYYCIYDSRVARALINYRKHCKHIFQNKFTATDLKQYTIYMRTIQEFKKAVDADNKLINQQIDRYLWICGEKTNITSKK